MKKIKRTIFFTLFFIAAIAIALVVIYQEQLQRRSFAYLAEQIENQTGYYVECGPMSFSYPFHWHVDSIQLSSESGPVLRIEDLHAYLSPWEWIHQHAVFDAIKIHKLTLEKIPQFSKSSVELSWNDIPWFLNIGLCEIDQLHLHEPVFEALNLKKHTPFLSPSIPLLFTGSGVINPHKKDLLFNIAISKAFEGQGATHIIASLTQKENLHLQIRIKEPDTGLLAKYYGLPEGYVYQGIVDTTLQNHENFQGDLQLSYEDTNSDLAPIIGRYGSLKSPFHFSAKGLELIQVEGIIGQGLAMGKCTLTPEGKYEDTAFQLAFHDTKIFPDIDISLKQARFDFSLSGLMRAPNIDLKLFSETVQLPFQKMENFSVHSNFSYETNIINMVINGNFTSQKHNWILSSTIAWNLFQNLLGISNISFVSDENLLKGDLQYDIANNFLVGELSGKGLDLFKPWIPFQEDQFSYNARFHTKQNSQNIDLQFHSPKIHLKELAAENSSLTIAIENAWKEPSALVRLSSEKSSWNNVSASEISCETIINSSASQWPFSITCKQGMLQLQSHGSWKHNAQASNFSLDALNGKFKSLAFALQDPVHVSIESNHFTVTPFFLQIGKGSFYAAADSTANNKHAIARLNSFPVEFLELFHFNAPSKGLLDASLLVNQTPYDVSGELQIALNGIDIHTESLSLPLQGSFNANLRDNFLSCTGKFTGLGLQPLNLEATFPLSLSLSPPKISIDPTQTFNARLSAEGRIESLLELLLPVSTTNLAGHTNLILDVAGSLQNPKISGQVNLTHGKFELLGIGASIQDVNAQIMINEDKAILTQLTAQGKGRGTITGTGVANLTLNPFFPFDLNFQLKQIPLQPASFANVLADGELRLKGDLKGSTLEGKLISEAISITMPERIPELAHSVEVTYINHPMHKQKPTACAAIASVEWPLKYHLELEVPRHCMLKGQDWSSEWKGSALLTGTSGHPLLHGTCKVIKGEYHFNGKSFEINEGTITFAGDPKKKTSLYVIAGKDIETMHVEVIAKGALSDPAIVFRSNPPMSQREILSWILFNRGASEITSFQGTQLNESITNLNKGNRQPDMLTKIRDRIGIDKIDICRTQDSETNDVSVQVGKYISQGVLISIHKSVTDQANRLSLEADLIKNFKVQAEVGDDADGQLRLKWKKDY